MKKLFSSHKINLVFKNSMCSFKNIFSVSIYKKREDKRPELTLTNFEKIEKESFDFTETKLSDDAKFERENNYIERLIC
jgi:hypothetical protein